MIGRLLCGLRPQGHDQLLHRDQGRLSVRCPCGWESPGIAVHDVPTPSKGEAPSSPWLLSAVAWLRGE